MCTDHDLFDSAVYGRVLYDNRLTQLLAKQLNNAHDAISTLTRAQILEDAFELAWAGEKLRTQLKI